MYPGMAEEVTTTQTVIMGVSPSKGHAEGLEAGAAAGAGAENGCKCGDNCTCNPCNCGKLKQATS
uniref:Metallothionein-like protein n=2 Tax=Oryza glaberrima TaxID=4538 RepID=I1NK83_ORYGL